jgi:hypothetical protein
MTTIEQRQLGRAKNAVMFYLERHLIVPKIYVDANWDSHPLDILAIDRDGVGDVHTVRLIPRKYLANGDLDRVEEWTAEKTVLDSFADLPAQFKYVGVVDMDSGRQNAPFEITSAVSEKSFSPDGIGRVGFLKIDVPSDGEPQIKLEIKPERFRAKIAKLADEYVQQHEPDWEIRA